MRHKLCGEIVTDQSARTGLYGGVSNVSDGCLEGEKNKTLMARLVCLCTTPRSGSEALSRALRDAGMNGPLEINHTAYRDYIARNHGAAIAKATLPEMIDALLRREKDVGHVAVKLFEDEFQTLRRARTMSHDLLVLLERRDVVAQVVSLVAVNVTGRALNSDDPTLGREVSALSATTVKSAIFYVCRSRRRWRRVFEAQPTALRLVSEDVFADPVEGMTQIASHLAPHNIYFDTTRAGQALGQSSRYEKDAELKARIRDEYSDLLAPLHSLGEI